LASFEKNLRIIERNYKAGVPGVRALDVQLGRNNVSSAQRGVSARELEQHNAARALELLLGRYPAASFATSVELPAVDADVPKGVPAQLLERRSDLRAARARLLAASKRIDVASKQLLPSVVVNLGAGATGAAFSVLGNAQQLVASVGANLAQNFDLAGNFRAEQRAAQARYEAALEDYAQASLGALREVEAAIDNEQSLQQQEVFLRKEVEQAGLAQRQAERDYSQGLDGADILSVLESQRRANSASAALIRLRNDRVQARVDLHLALGGDFR
jgi:outer membrane protein TolC